MNPDGSEQTNLTAKEFGSEFDEKDPAWSPDGKRIAFASDRGDDYDFNIYVMNVDGTGVTRLTDGPDDENLPRWSPDSEKIAYEVVDEMEHFNISVMKSDGTDATTVRKGPSPGFIGMSDWSPDSSRILFMVDRSYTGGEIDTYVMNEDGTCVKQLTDASGDDTGPRWSPDGKKILFGSNRKGGGIYLMNPDGTDQTRVLKSPPGLAEMNGFTPIWSPDGKQIAWTGKYAVTNDNAKIYVMDADGTSLTAIHGELETETVLDWQPVGR